MKKKEISYLSSQTVLIAFPIAFPNQEKTIYIPFFINKEHKECLLL